MRRIIVVHNHPNGNAFPSGSDKEATQRIDNICKSIGCELVDSLIVGKDGISSINSGEMKRYFTSVLKETVQGYCQEKRSQEKLAK